MNDPVCLLEPTEENIRTYVKKNEEEWGVSDQIIYLPCLKRMKTIKTDDDFKSLVRVILINWGMMQRVLNFKLRPGWENNLINSLNNVRKELEIFKSLLIDEIDLKDFEKDIKKCYKEIRNSIAPTATSKLLHFICPDFFPLWDDNIREQITKELRAQKKKGINSEESGYYRYMIEIQGFIGRYADVLSNLQDQYKKPKLRILDEFMWRVANQK